MDSPVNNNSCCKVCLGKNTECIQIFGEDGIESEIDTILCKHFGSEINLLKKDVICCECWVTVFKFHELYLKVECSYKKDIIVDVNPKDHVIIKNEMDESEATAQKCENDQTECVLLTVALVDEEDKKEELSAIKVTERKSSQRKKTKQKNVEKKEKVEEKVEEVVEQMEEEEDEQQQEEDTDTEDDADYNEEEESEDNYNDDDEDFVMDNDDNEKVEKPKAKRTKSKAKVAKTSHTVKRERISRKESDKVLEKLSLYFKMFCDLCLSPFTTFPEAIKHFKEVHDQPGYIICNCNKKFQHLYKITQHCIWHENPEVYKCSECLKNFIDSKGLRDHMDFMHCPEESRAYKCDLCPKAFKRQHMLTTHKRNQHNCRNFECPTCNQKFILQSTMNSHIKRVHENSDSRICDVCAKFFKCSKSYELHYLSNHTNVDQKVQCDECGKWLKHMDGLKDHKRRHAAKAEKCHICFKTCSNRKILRTHILRVHQAPRFKCTVCEKLFKTKQSLKEHTAIHEGLTDLYSCTFCTRTFRSNANMYAHRKRAHPVEYENIQIKDNLPPASTIAAAAAVASITNVTF